jgi:N-acetylglucosaminyldiphosphoundecaprenol N-acetyl-beta-D-mannosaminyltransferase
MRNGKKGRRISTVLGIKLDITTRKRVLRIVENWLKKESQHYIVTPNPEMLVLAQTDRRFLEVLNRADLSIPDGVGLKLADKRLKIIPGVELMDDLIKISSQKGYKVMLVGSRIGVAVKAAKRLRKKLKYKNIWGFSGLKKVETASKEDQQSLLNRINRIKPDLLFVGFGASKQEKWIARYLPHLDVKVAMGVGGAIDVAASPWKRAPQVMRVVGMEWLWRLFLQPWRWKRQLSLVKFVYLVLRERF